MKRSGAATDGQAFLTRRSIWVWEEQNLKCCPPMAQNLRISTQLLVILLSNLHRSHQKGNHFGKHAIVSQPKHTVDKQERRPSLLEENLNGRRQNPPEKIQLLDKVFSMVRGHSVEL